MAESEAAREKHLELKRKRESEGQQYIDSLQSISERNAESFDKLIIALSTGAIGLSLMIIKDIINVGTADHSWLLFSSWYGFAGTIMANIISYFICQKETNTRISNAKRFYYDLDENAFAKLKNPKCITSWFNIGSGILFVISMLLFLVFVELNLV